MEVVGGVDADCGRHQGPDAKEARLERVDCEAAMCLVIRIEADVSFVASRVRETRLGPVLGRKLGE